MIRKGRVVARLDIVIMGIEALLSSHRSKYRMPIPGPGEVVEGKSG